MRTPLVALAAIVCSGCAPMLYGPSLLPGPRSAAGFHTAPPQDPLAGVVGRWDQVIAIEPGAAVGLITAEGSAHAGTFVSAGTHFLTIHVNGGAREFERSEVARVDFLAPANRGSRGEEVLAGAAKGALMIGGALTAIPYLATGSVHLPPARFWAAGAVMGGVNAAGRRRHESSARTLYVSPDLIGKY